MLSCRSEGREPQNPVETGEIPDPNVPVEGEHAAESTPGPNPPPIAPERDLEPVQGRS
jgi:hypothetical protein